VNEELANNTRAPRRRVIFLKFNIEDQDKKFKLKDMRWLMGCRTRLAIV
jgi:hypothetical protein